MKNLVMLLLAVILGFVIAECIFKYSVRYPTLGISKFIYGINSNGNREPFYYPHARYIYQEGGLRFFQRNNLGLPGVDIVSKNKTNIAVLGSSFVEALEVEPSQQAVSIIDNLLNKNSEYQAINLGRKNHNMLDCLLRLNYYDDQIKIDYVIVVLDSKMPWSALYKEKQPITNFPVFIDNSLKTKAMLLSANRSSILSVILRVANRDIKKSQIFSNIILNPEIIEPSYTIIDNTLKELNHHYPRRIIIASIINSTDQTELSNHLAQRCQYLNIPYYSLPTINVQVNLINGVGHLNQKGNFELGSQLYQIFDKLITTSR